MRIDKNATLTYKKVFEITQNRKFKRIIDIGCGNTNLLKKIKQKKSALSQNEIIYTGAGFNISTSYKDIEIITNLDFNQDNWSNNINNNYDFILILDVIEHLENPYSFLRQIKTIASKECKVLISIPNIQSYRSRLRFLFTGKPSSFFPKEFLSSSTRNFDYHIWLPALELLKYFLRCSKFKLDKLHHIYGSNILTSHTLLIEASLK